MIAEEGKAGRKVGETWSAILVPSPAASNTKHLAAGWARARADFEERVAAVFVVLDRQPLEKRVASGAGSGGEMHFHVHIIAKQRCLVNSKVAAA